MKNWPAYMWVIFLGLILLLLTIVSYVFYLYSTLGIAWFYLALIGLIVAWFAYNTYKYRENYDLHIHHYTLGQIASMIICYQNPFVTVIHAIFTGVMIEGASRWGYDPIWVPKGEMSERTKSIVNKLESKKIRE